VAPVLLPINSQSLSINVHDVIRSSGKPRPLVRHERGPLVVEGGRCRVLRAPDPSGRGSIATGREHAVLARCKNRRVSVCPSCSDLYAADTWQLVTAGVVGGRHGMPNTVASHPAVFVTLTAPSFGSVHGVRAGVSGGARR